ncbi:hypothetical protein Aduo_016328 [Ancylostoma duodenale]
MTHMTWVALEVVFLAACLNLSSAQNAPVVPPPGVVVPVGCDEIQCAPFFVCVTRPLTCLSSVCPPMSTVPLCVPGDSGRPQFRILLRSSLA